MPLSVSLFAAGEHFSFFSLLGMDHHYVHVAMAAIVTILITTISLRLHRSYKTSKTDPLIPDARLSGRNIAELTVEQLYKLFHGILGHETDRYFPLLASMFLFIFINNLMGSIPGFLPATGNVSTNFALSLPVFLFYNYEGFKEHGAGYLKHFMGPVLWLAPLMVVIEVIGHFVRPVSLSLRLFGNITGDHTVLGIFSDLVPLFVPIIFMGLGLFVAFIQAFVFTLLSTIYIALAVSHDDH